MLYGLDSSGSGQGPVEGPCGHGNEPSGFIKCWKILEWLRNWQLLKYTAPWSYIPFQFTCYRMIRRGRRLTPSPKYNTHK
jgi:hypothetical protein